MQTVTTKASRSTVEQVTNNTTGWIGYHAHENKAIGKGQTFVASSEADIDNIAVYTNIVSKPGDVTLTIHEFDPQNKSWGPARGNSTVNFSKIDAGKWISFGFPSMHLQKGKAYGFRIESANSFIGIGEAAISSKQQGISGGQEWLFTDNGKNEDSYSYFSLAFKVGMRA